MTNIDVDKTQLRKNLRARRREAAGDAACALQAALDLRARFLDLLDSGKFALPQGAVIAAYYPLKDEMSPLPLLSALRARGYRMALPVTTGRDDPLTFRCFDDEAALRVSAFGVAEPVGGDAATPDLIVVPLLAFDDDCQRLGYGAGHYDRTLAATGAPAIGIAFDFQRAARLPAGPHDQPLDCVVTDKNVYWPKTAFKRQGR